MRSFKCFTSTQSEGETENTIKSIIKTNALSSPSVTWFFGFSFDSEWFNINKIFMISNSLIICLQDFDLTQILSSGQAISRESFSFINRDLSSGGLWGLMEGPRVVSCSK